MAESDQISRDAESDAGQFPDVPGPDGGPGRDREAVKDNLEGFARGTFWLRFGLREEYDQQFAEDSDRLLKAFDACVDEYAKGNARVRQFGPVAIPTILGYQTWEPVLYGEGLLDLGLITAGFLLTALSLLSGVVYALVGNTVIGAVGFALLALATATVLLVPAMLIYEWTRTWATKWRRLGVAISLLTLAGLGLSVWTSWRVMPGQALAVGIWIAVFLLVLAVFWTVLRMLIAAALFRRSWSHYVPHEIVQTLTSALAALDERDGETTERQFGLQATVAYDLEHVARVVDQYLPTYLTSGLAVRDCHALAEQVRWLARDSLFSSKLDDAQLRRQIGRLLVSVADGSWGDWDYRKGEGPVEQPEGFRTRLVKSMSRVATWVLLVTFVALLVGALVYATQAGPDSDFLGERTVEVLAAVLSAVVLLLVTRATDQIRSRPREEGTRASKRLTRRTSDA